MDADAGESGRLPDVTLELLNARLSLLRNRIGLHAQHAQRGGLYMCVDAITYDHGESIPEDMQLPAQLGIQVRPAA